MMRDFYAELDGHSPQSLKDTTFVPVDVELGRLLGRLDGGRRWSTVVAALPEGVTMGAATKRDFVTDDFLQAGGCASRMLVQVSRRLEDGTVRMETLGHTAPDESQPPAEKVEHGGHWTMVYPEEIWTAEQAVPVFTHYVRSGQTLPDGIHRRFFDVDNAPTG